jgi:predicted hotdog family 3-hydroxylacyl-ACP dehydratase
MDIQPLKQGEELLQYIPQRDPFVMVDQLYSIDNTKVISGFTITKENVLVEDKTFQEGGLIENMAQTTALFAGYKAANLGKEAPIGYIAGIKEVVIHKLPLLGDVLQTKAEIINELMNVQIVQAAVMDRQGQMLASCELRIFIKEES